MFGLVEDQETFVLHPDARKIRGQRSIPYRAACRLGAFTAMVVNAVPPACSDTTCDRVSRDLVSSFLDQQR